MTDLLGLAACALGFLALGAYIFGGPPVRGSLNGNFWAVPIGLIMAGAILMQAAPGGNCTIGYGIAGSYEDC